MSKEASREKWGEGRRDSKGERRGKGKATTSPKK